MIFLSPYFVYLFLFLKSLLYTLLKVGTFIHAWIILSKDKLIFLTKNAFRNNLAQVFVLHSVLNWHHVWSLAALTILPFVCFHSVLQHWSQHLWPYKRLRWAAAGLGCPYWKGFLKHKHLDVWLASSSEPFQGLPWRPTLLGAASIDVCSVTTDQGDTAQPHTNKRCSWWCWCKAAFTQESFLQGLSNATPLIYVNKGKVYPKY